MSEPVTLHTVSLDGKRIAYHSDSIFKVQVGRYKSKYKTRYSFKGSFTQALIYYKGINIGNGYKKRLICESFNKPVIARAFSQ